MIEEKCKVCVSAQFVFEDLKVCTHQAADVAVFAAVEQFGAPFAALLRLLVAHVYVALEFERGLR